MIENAVYSNMAKKQLNTWNVEAKRLHELIVLRGIRRWPGTVPSDNWVPRKRTHKYYVVQRLSNRNWTDLGKGHFKTLNCLCSWSNTIKTSKNTWIIWICYDNICPITKSSTTLKPHIFLPLVPWNRIVKRRIILYEKNTYCNI